MVSSHLQTFQNKIVKDYSSGEAIQPEQFVYRLSVEYDEEATVEEKLEAFSADLQAGKVTELIIGQFTSDATGSIDEVLEKLVELKDAFPALKSLFIGDIIAEECEISWIQQTDITPILKAFPNLEFLQVRGGDGLAFTDLSHAQLKTLIIETGGMPPEVVNAVAAAGPKLPKLERLDLWFGSDNYGFSSTVNDFAPFLSGKTFPALTHLGLMNSEIQDDIAIAAAQAPVLKQLKVLDLSMGTLTDKGGAALLQSEGIRTLQFLNLRRHYMTEDMMNKLKALPIPVNVDDQEEDEDPDYRYAEVTE